MKELSEEKELEVDSRPESTGNNQNSALGSVASFFIWILRVFFSASFRFYWDNGFSKAASLAYTSLVSLVPAIALCFGIFASFAVSSQYVPEVREFLFKQFVPDNQVVNQVLAYLTEFSNAISSLNVLVIGFLVVTTLLLINTIEYTLNEVWQVFEPRPITHRIGIFSSLILIAPVLFISGFYFIRFQIEPMLLDIEVWGSMLHSTYQTFLPLLIDFLAFLCLYFLVPKAPVRISSAAFGAFSSAICFGVAKSLFAYYLGKYASYDKIYGTLAAIPISLFWLYLSWTIVLWGAELCYQFQYLPKGGEIKKRGVMSIGNGRLLLAFQLLASVSHAFRTGRALPSDLDLAEELGCSSVVMKPTIDRLEKAGIISRGDMRTSPIALLKSPETIRVSQVVEALSGPDTAISYSMEASRLFGGIAEGKDLTLSEILGEGRRSGV